MFAQDFSASIAEIMFRVTIIAIWLKMLRWGHFPETQYRREYFRTNLIPNRQRDKLQFS